MAAISDPRHSKATDAVLDAFMGLPHQEDPNHIRLWEPGLTLARKVFHPKDWPLQDANAFIVKNLTLEKPEREPRE